MYRDYTASRLFPLLFNKLVQTLLKVKRSSDKSFRAESSSYGEYSVRKPFPFHVCTMDAIGNGNKRLTEM